METIKEWITLGKQYFDSKDYKRAFHFLRKAIEKNPSYADVHNILGVINHIEGRFQAAIESFKKALNINPRYTEAILNLAILYNDLGFYKDAKRLYTSLKKKKTKSGTQIEPVLRGKLSNLHAEIGDIYRSISLCGLAIDEYQKALNLNPNYHDIRTKLGQALRDDFKLEESKEELAKVVKANGKYSPAYVQLGVTYYSMGKLDQAKRSWKEALKQNSEDPYAQMYLRLCSTEALGKRKSKSKSKLKSKKQKRR